MWLSEHRRPHLGRGVHGAQQVARHDEPPLQDLMGWRWRGKGCKKVEWWQGQKGKGRESQGVRGGAGFWRDVEVVAGRSHRHATLSAHGFSFNFQSKGRSMQMPYILGCAVCNGSLLHCLAA